MVASVYTWAKKATFDPRLFDFVEYWEKQRCRYPSEFAQFMSAKDWDVQYNAFLVQQKSA